MSKISIIAAIGKQNRVIGNSAGEIPWHISEDFQYFKKVTSGHPIIMGRKTFESFGGRILPNRHHFIVTGQKNYAQKIPLQQNIIEQNITIANDIESAINGAVKIAKRESVNDVFIIGGAQIYSETIEKADKLYITIISKKDGTEINGSVFFPEYENLFKKEISRESCQNDEYFFDFVVLEK